MIAQDIFQQLSVGAIFKKEIKKPIPDDLNADIKTEESEEKKSSKSQKPISEEKKKLLHAEKINHIRKVNHIIVHGTHPEDPIETFGEMVNQCAVPQIISNNLIASGYDKLTAIQMQAIPIMAAGKSVMACAPTGSGKTAAFLVPIVRDLKKPKAKGFRAIILCPTRELAKQIQRECLRLVEGVDLKVHTISKTNQAETKYGPKSNKQFDILVTTPQRVCFLLNQNPPLLDLSNVQWLILDEADKLFEDGKNSFREQFDKIFSACTSDKKKVGLFSATWTMPVAKWGRKNLKELNTVSIGQRNSATELVDQELLFVGNEAGKLIAFRNLLREGLKPPVLVFLDSKDRAQQLYSELVYDAINVDVIHSDRTQQERDNVVKAFREGKVWVLICTELISRGIDFLGINLVVNYDFPPSAISYIHRIGRTGRAGRKGRAITYFTQDDKLKLRSIANIMQNSGCKVPEYMLTMKKSSKKVRRKLEKTATKREDIVAKSPRINSNRKNYEKLKKGENDKKPEQTDSGPPAKKKKLSNNRPKLEMKMKIEKKNKLTNNNRSKNPEKKNQKKQNA